MKLLIVTQAIDENNPVLGFFVNWVRAFSEKFEQVTVICLEKGEFDLPSNVQVFSLGKEKFEKLDIENSLKTENWLLKITRRIKYLSTFYYLLFTLRKQYDAVFVHMNQEYVILGWKFWKLWGKKIYLWRNHAYGNIWTRFAVLVSDKVFYTSPQSFTAKYKKSVQMPVGIDTDFFKPDPNVERIPNSVLFLGRIAPVKKVLGFVEWLKTTDYIATIAGPIGDEKYWEEVKLKIESLKLGDRVKFIGPVNQEGALKLYQTHEIYVNMTPAGSFDKTILEALACGCQLKVDNPVAKKLKIENHSLDKLSCYLRREMG